MDINHSTTKYKMQHTNNVCNPKYTVKYCYYKSLMLNY